MKSCPKTLREHVTYLLEGGGAHLTFEMAISGLPAKLRGKRPRGAPHSPWEIVEHLRIAQWDILEFSVNPGHVSPAWPVGYWPDSPAPASARAWQTAVRDFSRDLEAMQKLVADPTTDLFAPIPHGSGQTILREALLVADHNAYHLGELVLVRRLLVAWPEK
ncbi:MAG TPA: DinB family protein [Terriglobia bacterium]|nr:DinB family protein [Terriglobia bacterium]